MTRRLRIGLVLQGGARWAGGAQYGQNLYHALRSLPPAERDAFEVVPLAAGPPDPALCDGADPAFRRALRPGPPGRPAALAARAAELGIDFLYPHPPAAPGRRGPAYAAWIYDFQHRHLPGLFPAGEAARRDRAFARAARDAPRVVLSSEDARRDFARLFPHAHGKARVLPFCAAARPWWYRDDPGRVLKAYGLPERFFLACNQLWQHKNHQAAFRALARLRRGGRRPVLVCTGAPLDSRRPGYGEALSRRARGGGLAGQVRFLGLVPRRDQVQLARQALAVVQPSRFEGWSTVVEDARALGKPLALSGLAVHGEQGPPQAAYFDPGDPGALAAVLGGWWGRLPAGPDRRREARAREDNAGRLRAFARRFLAIARECVGREGA